MKPITVLPSLLLAGLLAAALNAPGPVSAKTAKIAKMPMASPAVLAMGKGITTDQGCTNCHGADLNGKKGFAPGLHSKEILKEYNKTTFERVMDTGITNDGKPVEKPMPTYHMKAAKSDALYAYLKSLK